MLCTTLKSDCWDILLKNVLTVAELEAISSLPKTPILSAIKLSTAIGVQRARRVIKLNGIYPEIDLYGQRRCCWIPEETGIRCNNYASIPACDEHFSEVSMLSQHFRSKTLRDSYEKLLTSKHKMHLDSEVAMMRTMLGVLIGKMNENTVNVEQIASVTHLCEKIAAVVDKMSKLNSITPEVIDKMLSQVTDIVARYVPADRLASAAAELATISPQVSACDIEFLPGDSTNIGDSVRTITAMVEDQESQLDDMALPAHKAALLEVAAQLRVVEAPDATRD